MAGFFSDIVSRLRGGKVDFDEIEEILIRSDLGLPTTTHLLREIKKLPPAKSSEEILEATRSIVRSILITPPPEPGRIPGSPRVILIVGVNGVGKTTTAAKVASRLSRARHSVLLAAADTYRAAAIEQLEVWGNSLNIPVHAGNYGADPASVCHDAGLRVIREQTDFLVCDTAGRQHTRDNLMQQLGKISRSLQRLIPGPNHDHWLVVDGGTGSNALVQAREFHEAIGLTGIIVTKHDGSGRGGAVVAIAHELKIPTLYLGTGERIGDLERFDPGGFISGLF